MEVHSYNSSYSGIGVRRFTVWGWPGQKHETLPQKQTKSKKARGGAQVVAQDPEFNP
jgi:hypothetical protein